MEIWATKPHPKHAIANCSQTVGLMLPPGEYKEMFPFFAKFLWSPFIAYANNFALDTVWCLLGNLAGLYVSKIIHRCLSDLYWVTQMVIHNILSQIW